MQGDTNNHKNETMHSIPFIHHEYLMHKARVRKNRIVYALCVTNIAWFVLALISYIRYEKI